LAILIEQVDALRQLSKEGYIARSNLLDKERETSQLRASIAEDTATVEKLNRQINESTERLEYLYV
jgi:protease secretion system membrane fusion protein